MPGYFLIARVKSFYSIIKVSISIILLVTAKQEFFQFFAGIANSPIAISLGSYMDKAAGRRPCTGKNFTQDVSVLSRSCLGLVSVMSRSCLGHVSVVSRSCLGLVSVLSR